MRDHYVRAISGSNKKSGAGRDDLLKYPHMDAILFIKPLFNIRATNAVSNIQSSLNEEEKKNPLFVFNMMINYRYPIKNQMVKIQLHLAIAPLVK